MPFNTLLRKRSVHLVLIAILGLIVFSNTFDVPFQWDDHIFIKNNSLVKDMAFFSDPSTAVGLPHYEALKRRYIGFLTFAINYNLHGFGVRGYHAFNITIHILNALLVYTLVVLTFRTPFLGGSSLKNTSGYIALFTSLLFVSHPIQTEAVTYIFQRLASLAAMFYLGALVFYIKWRLGNATEPQSRGATEPQRNKRLRRCGTVALYLLSLLSAVFAMKTKENAFTLPISIALYEFFFFKGAVKARLLRLTPFFLTMVIVPMSYMEFDTAIGEIADKIYAATNSNRPISRSDYFITQIAVIVTYIRLLLLPIRQNFGYDYPVFHSLLNPTVLASLFLLVFILGAAACLYYKSRFPVDQNLRMIAFGILWFFIALSVESSIIPLPMLINEYRIYLPSVGVFMAMTTGLSLLLMWIKNKPRRNIAVLIATILIFVLSFSTYSRNVVWKTEIGLWEDTVKKSPLQAQAHYNLGVAYEKNGEVDKAISCYEKALELSPRASAYLNLGKAYWAKGITDRAVEYFRSALNLNPFMEEAHYNLGLISIEKNMLQDAQKEFELVLMINPQHPKAGKFLKYLLNSSSH